jgi:hypothetical protein
MNRYPIQLMRRELSSGSLPPEELPKLENPCTGHELEGRSSNEQRDPTWPRRVWVS